MSIATTGRPRRTCSVRIDSSVVDLPAPLAPTIRRVRRQLAVAQDHLPPGALSAQHGPMRPPLRGDRARSPRERPRSAGSARSAAAPTPPIPTPRSRSSPTPAARGAAPRRRAAASSAEPGSEVRGLTGRPPALASAGSRALDALRPPRARCAAAPTPTRWTWTREENPIRRAEARIPLADRRAGRRDTRPRRSARRRRTRTRIRSRRPRPFAVSSSSNAMRRPSGVTSSRSG